MEQEKRQRGAVVVVAPADEVFLAPVEFDLQPLERFVGVVGGAQRGVFEHNRDRARRLVGNRLAAQRQEVVGLARQGDRAEGAVAAPRAEAQLERGILEIFDRVGVGDLETEGGASPVGVAARQVVEVRLPVAAAHEGQVDPFEPGGVALGRAERATVADAVAVVAVVQGFRRVPPTGQHPVCHRDRQLLPHGRGQGAGELSAISVALQARRLGRVGQEGDFRETDGAVSRVTLRQQHAEILLAHAAVVDVGHCQQLRQHRLRQVAAAPVGVARHPHFGAVDRRVVEAVEVDREEDGGVVVTPDVRPVAQRKIRVAGAREDDVGLAGQRIAHALRQIERQVFFQQAIGAGRVIG